MASRHDSTHGGSESGDQHQAEELLNRELRDVVGDDRARVSPELVREERGGRGRGGFVDALARNRYIVILTLAMLIVAGAAIAVMTGEWIILPIAIVIHLIGTAIVIGMTVQLTTQVEHADPGRAATMERAGITDPDHALAEAVEEHARESGDEDAERASRQRRSVTPDQGAGGGRSREVGPGDDSVS